MSDTIDISNLDKSDVLSKLYNASKPLGLGFLHYNPSDMTKKEAQKLLDSGTTYFDYLYGRVMKIDLSTNDLDVWAYDRDNGDGACAKALNIV